MQLDKFSSFEGSVVESFSLAASEETMALLLDDISSSFCFSVSLVSAEFSAMLLTSLFFCRSIMPSLLYVCVGSEVNHRIILISNTSRKTSKNHANGECANYTKRSNIFTDLIWWLPRKVADTCGEILCV
jgi:hypothetical protein